MAADEDLTIQPHEADQPSEPVAENSRACRRRRLHAIHRLAVAGSAGGPGRRARPEM